MTDGVDGEHYRAGDSGWRGEEQSRMGEGGVLERDWVLVSVVSVCLIVILMSLYEFSGYEIGATVAKETQHPCLLTTLHLPILLSSLTPFLFLLSLLYT